MLSVNSNFGASVALQSLNSTNKELNQVQNRISTGYKVASARDNGAVYAIAEGQRALTRTAIRGIPACPPAAETPPSATAKSPAPWSTWPTPPAAASAILDERCTRGLNDVRVG